MATPPSLQFDQDTIAKMQRARAAGYDDNTILQKASAYQATKAQTQQPQKQGFNPADLLPLVGGLAGSFIPGLGNIVGGAAGAGLGTLLKQAAKNEPFSAGEALKETALAGAGGVVGKGIGAVAGKVLPKVAPGITEAGESLAKKAFRINPGQATKFAEETGEDFGKFLTKRGIFDPSKLDDAVTALQQPFDEIVMSSDLVVPQEKIVSEFAKKITNLNKSIIPADKAKAKVVEQIMGNFTKQYGSGPLPAAALTELRKEIDSGITKFALDEAVKGPLNITRDVLQGSLRDVADEAGLNIGGRSLKEAGVELSKLYKAQEIATRQGNLGAGSAPAGILRLLGGAVGGATGGIPGAIAGTAGVAAVNSPESLSLLSRFATGAGKAAQNLPQFPAGAGAGLERAGVGAGSLLGGVGQPTGEMPELPTTGGYDQLTSAGSAGAPTAPIGMGGGGQEDQIRQVLGALMLSKAKTSGDLKTAYEFLYPTQKPLSDTQQKTKAAAESGLRSLGTAEQILTQDPNAPLKANIPIVKGRSPYAAASREVVDAFSRIRSGAALTPSEVKFYESQLPQTFDSAETIKYKLGIFRNLFEQLAYGQVPATPEIPTVQAF